MSIKHWPKAEQPREKLLQLGAEKLSDAELLAIFISTGNQGKTALDLARDSLNHFGDLKTLLKCRLHEFSSLPGLGKAKYVQLQAALELTRRYLFERLEHVNAMNHPEKVKEYLSCKMQHYSREVFSCLLLDCQYHVITYKELFWGSIKENSVYPRELVRFALNEHNASNIIFAHNHPSGNATPSDADIELTKRLKPAFELVDIHVIDHIIIGHKTVSMAEMGLI